MVFKTLEVYNVARLGKSNVSGCSYCFQGFYEVL